MAASDLSFCKNCSNMLYFRDNLETTGKYPAITLVKYCKRCGYFKELSEKEDGRRVAASAGASAAAAGAADVASDDDSDFPSGDAAEIVVFEKSYEQATIRPTVDLVAFGDPAVPTTTEIVCPNKDCGSSSAKFIVANPNTYSILYCCNACQNIWRNDN